MNPLRQIFEWLRNLFWPRSFEHWDLAKCEAERRESGLCFNQTREDEVLAEHGEPTLVEIPSMQQLDAQGNVVWEADRGLVYDHLLRRTRVVFYIDNGAVHGIMFLPKLKRCPPHVRRETASYYSPE